MRDYDPSIFEMFPGLHGPDAARAYSFLNAMREVVRQRSETAAELSWFAECVAKCLSRDDPLHFFTIDHRAAMDCRPGPNGRSFYDTLLDLTRRDPDL